LIPIFICIYYSEKQENKKALKKIKSFLKNFNF